MIIINHAQFCCICGACVKRLSTCLVQNDMTYDLARCIQQSLQAISRLRVHAWCGWRQSLVMNKNPDGAIHRVSWSNMIWEVLSHDQRIGLGTWSDLSWISDPERCLEMDDRWRLSSEDASAGSCLPWKGKCEALGKKTCWLNEQTVFDFFLNMRLMDHALVAVQFRKQMFIPILKLISYQTVSIPTNLKQWRSWCILRHLR